MLVLPLLLLVVIGVVAYRTIQHRHALTAAGTRVDAHVGNAPEIRPSTVLGWAALAALGLAVASMALVNIVAVPFLGSTLVIVSFALAAGSRFIQRDRSLVVLVVLIVAGLAFLAAVAFLVGELAIGHG